MWGSMVMSFSFIEEAVLTKGFGKRLLVLPVRAAGFCRSGPIAARYALDYAPGGIAEGTRSARPRALAGGGTGTDRAPEPITGGRRVPTTEIGRAAVSGSVCTSRQVSAIAASSRAVTTSSAVTASTSGWSRRSFHSSRLYVSDRRASSRMIAAGRTR